MAWQHENWGGKSAMVEAAEMAEKNMDVFRRALLQKAAKRRAALADPDKIARAG